MIVNPFLVPGLEENPQAPLRPFELPVHEEFYVPVDRTEQAFQEFVEHTRTPAALRDTGRLVVALGPTGCGKTALVNRCVADLVRRLAADGRRARVFDLTREAHLLATIEARVGMVCARLLDDVRAAGLIDDARRDRLRDRMADDPARVYPALSSMVEDADRVVLVVLLPPTRELVGELEMYAGWARRGIVFFAETSAEPEYGTVSGRVAAQSQVPPVLLRVGPLRAEDGHLFTRSRLARHHGTGGLPTVSEQTMREVTGTGRVSIAGLQKLLFGIYQQFLTMTAPPAELTADRIARYWLETTFG